MFHAMRGNLSRLVAEEVLDKVLFLAWNSFSEYGCHSLKFGCGDFKLFYSSFKEHNDRLDFKCITILTVLWPGDQKIDSKVCEKHCTAKYYFMRLYFIMFRATLSGCSTDEHKTTVSLYILLPNYYFRKKSTDIIVTT